MASFIRKVLSRSVLISRQWPKFRSGDLKGSSVFALILGGSVCYGSFVGLKKLHSIQTLPFGFATVKAKQEENAEVSKLIIIISY